MEWYYYVLIIIVIGFGVYLVVNPMLTRKNIYQLFLDNQNKDGKERYEIIEARKKSYDYCLKAEYVHLYIRYVSIPSNSQICINAKETWALSYGGNQKNKGRVYPNKTYLDELTHFLQNDIKGDELALKVILLYKKTEGIVRYLNESELETIDIKKTPYGYKVMQCACFQEELEYILKYYEEKK